MMPKFRAWDKHNKEMYRVHGWVAKNEIYICSLPNSAFKDDVLHTTHVITKSLDDFIIMQSTGVKDVNGVEIYEGDICECDDGLVNYWYVVEWVFASWQTVTYKKSTAKVNGISDGISQDCLDTEYAASLAVVGNIHENPELLSEVE